jgi:hypothetical protein
MPASRRPRWCRAPGRPSSATRWCNERGQSTALVLSMLFILVLFVGVVANVGQAVNRRIALQLAADAGAWTGASAMATGLNAMAFWNRRMQNFWSALTIATAGFTTTPSCEVTDTIFRSYRAGHQILSALYQITNRGFARLPNTEAHRVSRYNIFDLFPGELGHFEADGSSFLEWDDSPEVGITRQRNAFDLMPSAAVPDGTWALGEVPGLVPSRREVTYTCLGVLPPGPQVRTATLPVWFMKADPGVASFVWIMKAPATSALMFDDIFGPAAIPEMRAAAAAKPVGGSLIEGRSEYVAKMIPLDRVSSGVIQDSFFYQGVRTVVH